MVRFFARGIYQPDLISKALSMEGFKINQEHLIQIGEAIYKEKYRFKMREGFSLDDVRILKRIFETPSLVASLNEEYLRKALVYLKGLLSVI